MPQIPTYPLADALTGTELFVAEQNGSTKRVTSDLIKNFADIGIPVASVGVLGGIRSGGDISIDGSGIVTVLSAPATWASITGKPTTLAGYGITDAASISHSHVWGDILAKPTTLAGYGITNAVDNSHLGGEIHIDWTVDQGLTQIHPGNYISITDHTQLTNIGTNTHVQIDSHIANTNAHIDWTASSQNLVTSADVLASNLIPTIGIYKSNETGLLASGGGTSELTGGVLKLYGSAYAPNPSGFAFYSDNSLVFEYSGGVFSFTGALSSNNLSGTNTGDQTITLTGAVSGTGTGNFPTTIDSSFVDHDLTINYSVTEHLDWTTNLSPTYSIDYRNIPIYSDIVSGAVPASGGGTTLFLRADGTWATPSGAASATNSWETLAITNTDTGFTWAASGSIVAVNATDVMTFVSGQNIELAIDSIGDGIRISAPAAEIEASVNHDNLVGFVTNEHIDWTNATQNISTTGTIAGSNLSGSNTGDQTITLTGDVTGSGTGSFAATITNDSVTFDKVENINTSTILGRVTAAEGNIEELTGAQTNTILPTFTGSLKGLAPASGGGTNNFLRADGNWSVPSFSLSDNAVSNTKLSDMVAHTLKARVDATTGDPSDLAISTNSFAGRLTGDLQSLSGTQATTLLDEFTTTLKGLAPASGGGTTNFLRADGTWVAPPGGASGNSFETQTVTDTDTGFTWAETGSVVADSATDTLTWVSGTGIDIDVDAASDAIRISATGSGGLTSAYTSVTDGTTTSSASGADTFKLRSSDSTINVTVQNNDATHGDNVDLAVNEANVAHDSLSGFVANEHIDHSTIDIIAGTGLSGGGAITADVTLNVDLNELTTEATIASGDFISMVDITDNGSGKITFANFESTLNHDNLVGFVTNEHIDWTNATQNISTTGTIAGSNLSGSNTGDQTITLTGDVTGSGTGSFAATITNDAVTNSKLANMLAHTLKARVGSTTGDSSDLAISTNSFAGRLTGNLQSLSGTQSTTLLNEFTTTLKGLVPGSGGGTSNFLRADGTWVAPPGTYSHPTHPGDDFDIDTTPLTGATVISDLDINLVTDTLGHVTDANAAIATRVLTLADLGYTGATDANNYVHPNHTGDVTSTGDGATVIATNAVTLAKIQQITTDSLLGRDTAGTGNVEVLTGTQATTLLDEFTTTLKGLVPGSGGGTTNFLRADGTWVAPPGGGGGVTSVAISGTDGIEVDSGSPITTSGTITLGLNTATLETNLNHDNLTGFVANEHINWTNATANFLTTGTLESGAATFNGQVLANVTSGNYSVIFESINGGKAMQLVSEGGAANSRLAFTNADGGVDAKSWALNGKSDGTLHIETLNDAEALQSSVMSFSRAGNITVAGTLYIKNAAAAAADAATYGQLWVNSANDKLYFTDETGVDYDLTAIGSGLNWPAPNSIFSRIRWSYTTEDALTNRISSDTSLSATTTRLVVHHTEQLDEDGTLGAAVVTDWVNTILVNDRISISERARPWFYATFVVDGKVAVTGGTRLNVSYVDGTMTSTTSPNLTQTVVTLHPSNYTISTSAPSGTYADGHVWYRY